MKEFWYALLNKVDGTLAASIILIVTVLFFLLKKTLNFIVKNSYEKIVKFISNLRVVNVKELSKEQLEKPISELLNHRCVFRLDRLKHERHEFYTHGERDYNKEKAFEVFLEAKMESTIQHIRQIVSNASYEMHKSELRGLVEHCFSACNNNVITSMIKKFTDENLTKTDAEKLTRKFLDVRNSAMDVYSEIFDEVFQEMDVDNYETLRMVLLLIHAESQGMVTACVMAFEEINGAFKAINYGDTE
jgi:hypothetical protein